MGGFTYKSNHNHAMKATWGIDWSIKKVGKWDYLRAEIDTDELEVRDCNEVIWYHYVMGAACGKMDPKVATVPKTQSPLTIKVEIKMKFNSRIKR